MPTLWTRLYFLINATACVLALSALAQADALIEPDWRISRVAVAPWAPDAVGRHGARPWVGQSVTFRPGLVDGPSVLHCRHAALQPTRFAAEALFQGNLPAPAVTAAQSLGIGHLPLAGVSLTCDTGVFEFHRVDPDSLLLGLDNQVLTLSHAPGALAPAHAPEGRVQRLLEAHFSCDMGFSSSTVKAKRIWLSTRLKKRIADYFSRPAPADAVPVIAGDPFTDSQEYPLRFAVGKAVVSNGLADVAVRFADAARDRTVVYRMRREGGAWRVDDLRYAGGETLLGLLK